ncbi:MAG: hypothetical protein JWO60_108 [Frankiales bacterium]|nr:hypothetical protein [Frankiales bacterium]
MNRRNQVLFLLATVGFLAVVGTGVYEWLGRDAALGYAVGAAVLVLHTAARARRAEAARRRAAGRTCTCCTTSHFDPVEVV